MYVKTLIQGFGEEGIEYQSAQAAQQAVQRLYDQYQSDCQNIDVLQRLTRSKLSLYDEGILLRRRIAELPQLFRDRVELDRRARLWQDSWADRTRVFSDPVAERRRIEEFVRRTGALSPKAYRIELAKLLVKLGYPPDYNLSSDLNKELAIARCELSRNSWRSAASCGGMEEDDPQSMSRQVAEHYLKTEFG
jgi:hypothetical protein